MKLDRVCARADSLRLKILYPTNPSPTVELLVAFPREEKGLACCPFATTTTIYLLRLGVCATNGKLASAASGERETFSDS